MEQLKYKTWYLSDLKKPDENSLKVFSCFHCGGGSTMGYKLAGLNVLGGVEIDPKMMEVYRTNHKPKHSFLMGVQDFKKIPNENIPEELFNLDILDGSPPCSSFSTSGSREKAWGKEKKFREGQAVQILDDLFFEFIDVAEKLKPKIVVSENVKGMIMGKAKGYVKMVIEKFDKIGYDTQLFLLNAAFMGVPQRRERVFFISRRKDLGLKKLNLEFNMKPISVQDALYGLKNQSILAKKLTPETVKLWEKVKPGQSLAKVHPNGSRFNCFKSNPFMPSNTVAANEQSNPMHWSEPRRFSTLECGRIQSFPDDFNYLEFRDNYIQGMSVPPYMMEKIALEIKRQWFSK